MFIIASFIFGLVFMPVIKFLSFIADLGLGWGASYALGVMVTYVALLIRSPKRK